MPWSRPIRPRSGAELGAAASSIAVVAAAALLPWHRSGRVDRRGFELARSVDRAGLVASGWQEALLVGAFFLPMLGALVLLGLALGRRRLAGIAAVVCGGVAVVAAGVVLDLGGARPGPVAAGCAGVAGLACGASLVLKGTR